MAYLVRFGDTYLLNLSLFRRELCDIYAIILARRIARPFVAFTFLDLFSSSGALSERRERLSTSKLKRLEAHRSGLANFTV